MRYWKKLDHTKVSVVYSFNLIVTLAEVYIL